MRKFGLRGKVISLFVMTSTLPIIVLSLFFFYNTSITLRKNTEVLTQTNLKQVNDNMQIWLDSYEDLLYQIYTNDDVVKWVDNLNQKKDVPVTVNQLRRFLRGLLNTKDYIRSITVITDGGDVITYDQLTPATYENSWIKNFSMDQDQLYECISSDNHTHILPTEYGTRFANNDYYLFHLCHRIIDYKKLEKKNGIVILSLDERLLQNILQTDTGIAETSVNFLVGENGRIVSIEDQNLLGKRCFETDIDPDKKAEAYKQFCTDTLHYDPYYAQVYVFHDEELGWDIVNYTNQTSLMENFRKNALLVAAICFLLLIASIPGLKGVLDKEKEEGEKQRQAEIKALEAQINPHFLYNTLDTINWMALDKDEFDISNAIGTLATILRYAITNSNEKVTVKDEADWLKKYIYLQQFRLKNKFSCQINISPEIMGTHLHKLLLQPFVENAILHGFSGEQEVYHLEVIMQPKDGGLQISICDNGKGMEPEILEDITKGKQLVSKEKNHIGMENAMTRLHMYYKGQEKIEITSKVGEGTCVNIWLPIEE